MFYEIWFLGSGSHGSPQSSRRPRRQTNWHNRSWLVTGLYACWGNMTEQVLVRRAKARIKEALYGTRIFVPVQRTYQRIFNPAAVARRHRMRALYSRLFQRGDLVFDIGAYDGVYSEVFASLGAHVIAVEPIPECRKVLDKLSRRTTVRVEQCAAGDALGRVALWICEDSHLSTVSERWLQRTKEMPSLCRVRWQGSIDVDVTTLDVLALRYGVPRFIKIDVEGYEEQVLSGMSFSPDCLSFEFHTSTVDVVRSCLERLRVYEFNVLPGLQMDFAYSNWVSPEEIVDWIGSYRGDQDFGEIFAR